MDDHESTWAEQLAPAGSSFLLINGCRQYLCISGMSAHITGLFSFLHSQVAPLPD